MALYTRTGDTGDTSLFDGTRVSKGDPLVDVSGEVDELGAHLGMALAIGLDSDLVEIVIELQRDLFALGAQVADPGGRIAERVTKIRVGDKNVQRMEEWIDRLDEKLPPLRRFILANGSPAAVNLHLARSVCRRVERRIVALGLADTVPILVTYVNRLSDLLFVLARTVNSREGLSEIEW